MISFRILFLASLLASACQGNGVSNTSGAGNPPPPAPDEKTPAGPTTRFVIHPAKVQTTGSGTVVSTKNNANQIVKLALAKRLGSSFRLDDCFSIYVGDAFVARDFQIIGETFPPIDWKLEVISFPVKTSQRPGGGIGDVFGRNLPNDIFSGYDAPKVTQPVVWAGEDAICRQGTCTQYKAQEGILLFCPEKGEDVRCSRTCGTCWTKEECTDTNGSPKICDPCKADELLEIEACAAAEALNPRGGCGCPLPSDWRCANP